MGKRKKNHVQAKSTTGPDPQSVHLGTFLFCKILILSSHLLTGLMIGKTRPFHQQ